MDAQHETEGLVTLPSHHDFKTTLGRLGEAITSHQAAIFAMIDHAAGATAAGQVLRPSTVLIFGNPQAGTPLMQAQQIVALDLPLRVLVWEDEAGAVWLSYNTPDWIARRHGLDPDLLPTTARMAEALQIFTHAAGG